MCGQKLMSLTKYVIYSGIYWILASIWSTLLTQELIRTDIQLKSCTIKQWRNSWSGLLQLQTNFMKLSNSMLSFCWITRRDPNKSQFLALPKKTTGPDLLVPLKTARVSTRGRFNPNYPAHGSSSQDQADIQFQHLWLVPSRTNRKNAFEIRLEKKEKKRRWFQQTEGQWIQSH